MNRKGESRRTRLEPLWPSGLCSPLTLSADDGPLGGSPSVQDRQGSPYFLPKETIPLRRGESTMIQWREVMVMLVIRCSLSSDFWRDLKGMSPIRDECQSTRDSPYTIQGIAVSVLFPYQPCIRDRNIHSLCDPEFIEVGPLR